MKKIISSAALALALFTSGAFAAGTSPAMEASSIDKGLAAITDEKYDVARTEFMAAAGHGNPMGYYHLGAMYHRGLGGERSQVKALENYRKAADQGVPEAEFAMGLFYQHGKAFLQKNPDTAVDWYTKAARQGSAAAMYNLGMMYATGEAVPITYGSNPDYIKARGWFLITREAMASPGDEAKVDGILKELESHMTPRQMNKSKEFQDEWNKQNS
ncbi:tetratricopeptide repeat protein [Magnetovibrio sp. PR-2]|uniref:tetratricopeptide repeat protein n=1 Tax=Magnetovibrio sp. PR-2 TaxID=3120356 RepID=UPI002FCE15FE